MCSKSMARWRAASRSSFGISTEPPRPLELSPACAASSTIPPIWIANSGVRWNNQHPVVRQQHRRNSWSDCGAECWPPPARIPVDRNWPPGLRSANRTWPRPRPHGSEQAVANIRAAITPGVPAVLLANHGVLVFTNARVGDPDWRNRGRGRAAGLNSSGLGGSVEIPKELREAASSAPCSSSNMERRTPSELAPLFSLGTFGARCQK